MAKTTYTPAPAKIKAIGIGGGGSNAINRMVREGIRGVEFITMNTDAQALALSEAPTRIQLGEKLTRGLGAGGDHRVGYKAAEESKQTIQEVVEGADMVFVAAGMGGGTGTGGMPVVAQTAKESGALTIGVVTKPFKFEGGHRSEVAEEGILSLTDKVDTLIIIPNDRLLQLCDAKTTVDSAFRMADDALLLGVQAIRRALRRVLADRQGAGPAWPDRCASQANQAWAILRDPESRAAYDRQEREKAIVVSSDAAVARAAESCGAAALDSPAFEARVAMAVALEGADSPEEEGAARRISTRKKGAGKRLPKRMRQQQNKTAKL